jgi:hypothetical protein
MSHRVLGTTVAAEVLLAALVRRLGEAAERRSPIGRRRHGRGNQETFQLFIPQPQKEETMMPNPSRTVVIWLTLIAIAGLVLGLATDVGLFGWSLSALLALYLAVVILTRFVRPRPSSNREPT